MKTTPTIHSLRRQGYKVAVIHKPSKTFGEGPTPRSTHIIVTDLEKRSAEGFSFTHPGDRYNRKIGNAIALGRALKNLEHGVLCSWVPPATEL